MPILTDSVIDVGTYTTFNIGLSKAISNYTADEIFDFPYCSSSWDMFRHINDVSYDDYAPGRVEPSEFQFPFHFEGMNQLYTPSTYYFNEGQIEYNQGDLGIYGRVIWLCKTGDTSIGHIFGLQRCITNTDGVKIITQMDMTKVFLFLNDFITPHENDINYLDFDNIKIKEEHDNTVSYSHPNNCSIFPAVMFKYNGKLYIHRLTQNSYTSLDWSWWLSYYGDSDNGGHTEKQGYNFNAQPVSFDQTTTAYLPINIMRQFAGLRPTSVERHYTMSDIPDVGVSYQWEYAYTGGRITPNTLAKYLQMTSWYGCMFKHGETYYKPIIENGYVTGYTDNMTTPSEIDNYIGQTNHSVPNVAPGTGGGSGDELTDMLSRGQFYGSGLTKYYVDPPAAKLQKALGDWDNIATGKDVLQNLLSYKILCFPSTTFSNGITDPFVIAGTELKDENDTTITAKRLTSTGAVNLPNITIPPTFNDFRDYAPYTKIQMFVPLCGWFDLPPWCMGRKISGEMYINPYSGTVRCLVRADGNVVAELGGNASIDLPFNATAVGMKTAAVLSNLIQTAGAVGRAVMLPTVNTLAGAGSAALGTVCALNANYTEIKGTMGDGSNVYGLYNVYIKITRPATIDNSGNSLVTIPNQYCHDYGRPCNKQLKLTAGDGYTQILDANITGAMTDREKQMIIDGFRHGLIL